MTKHKGLPGKLGSQEEYALDLVEFAILDGMNHYSAASWCVVAPNYSMTGLGIKGIYARIAWVSQAVQ